MTKGVKILLLLFFLINCETKPKKIASKKITFKKEAEILIFNNKKDTIAQLDIELATTDYERQTGMMYRRQMDPNKGMYFIFPSSQPRSFYMKNTLISLDVLFIDEDNTVFKIVKEALPKSQENINSISPAKYVLELLGGQADALEIKEGAQIKLIVK
tara:strand:- start:4269 stop:4742 length:474 start_codon:yes stop_codon:yes gene_type:complete